MAMLVIRPIRIRAAMMEHWRPARVPRAEQVRAAFYLSLCC